MKFFYLTWSNLKRKKFRTLLTLLSIVVAFVLFGFLSAIKQALTGGVTISDSLVKSSRRILPCPSRLPRLGAPRRHRSSTRSESS